MWSSGLLLVNDQRNDRPQRMEQKYPVTTHQQADIQQQPENPPGETRLIRTAIIGPDTERIAGHPQLETQDFRCLQTLFEDNQLEAEPELIVIYQNFSDQFCPAEIDQLFKRYPLSLCLCVYGPLCESDGRTRNLWPQSLRVPHWKLHQRIEREIEVLAGNSPALPITATREETFRFEFQSPSAGPSLHPMQAVVFSPDAIWTEMITEALATERQVKCRQIHSMGEMEVFLALESSFDGLIILDTDPLSQAMKQWLKQWQQKISCDNILKFPASPESPSPGSQILAVSNWVTSYRKEELRELGVNHYVCKLNLPEILGSYQ